MVAADRVSVLWKGIKIGESDAIPGLTPEELMKAARKSLLRQLKRGAQQNKVIAKALKRAKV